MSPDDTRSFPTSVDALAEKSVAFIPGVAQVLLVGGHAGHEIPVPWGNLGLPSELFASHFGVDIGIRNLITQVAKKAKAPAVLARYSRIFLDYNRPKTSVEYCRPDLAGIPVPLNLSLSPQEVSLRQVVAAWPLDKAIEHGMHGKQILFPIHSFTPIMNGETRGVDIGLLYREATPLISTISNFLSVRCLDHGLGFGHEKPYAYNPAHNETLKRHGYNSGRPGFQIEVRKNLLGDSPEFETICAIVSELVSHICD